MRKRVVVAAIALAVVSAGAFAGRKLLARKIEAPASPSLIVRESKGFAGGGHHGGVGAAAFSDDGLWLATGSWDASVCIWDVAARRIAVTLLGHKSAVLTVAFSPDAKSVVTGSWDNLAKVWDRATGTERFTLAGHANWVNGVAWSPDGALIATAGADNTVRLWDAATGKPAGVLQGHSFWATAVAFSADGKTLISGGRDGTVRLWDVASRRETFRYGQSDSAHGGRVGWVGFAAGAPVSGGGDGTMTAWRAGVDERLAEWQAHLYSVMAAGVSEKAGFIVTTGSEKVFRFWGFDGRPLTVGRGHSAPVKCVAVTRDGKLVASGGWDNTLRLWDVVPVTEP